MAENDRALVQLAPDMLKTADWASTYYDVVIPDGVTLEDLEMPEFWSHDAKKLRAWDQIRARSSDGAWMANYLVMDCDRTWARVKRLELYDLRPAEQMQSEEVEASPAEPPSPLQALKSQYDVRARGPAGWSVIRLSDSEIMAERLGSRVTAQKWLNEWAERQLGGGAAPPQSEVA